MYLAEKCPFILYYLSFSYHTDLLHYTSPSISESLSIDKKKREGEERIKKQKQRKIYLRNGKQKNREELKSTSDTCSTNFNVATDLRS